MGKIEIQPPPVSYHPDLDEWDILDDGVVVARASLDVYPEEKTIRIFFFRLVGRETLSPGIIRQGFRLIREEYPWVEKVIARRATGAKHADIEYLLT